MSTFRVLGVSFFFLYSASLLAAESVEALSLPREGSGCRFEYGLDASAVEVEFFSAKHYRLYFGKHIRDDFDSAITQRKIDEAIARVLGSLGPFRRKIEIYLVDSIEPIRRKCESGRVIAVCYKDAENIVVIRKDRLHPATLTHEFVHAWFNEQRREPDSWLEEGIAEYVETLRKDGFSQFHFNRLSRSGFVAFEEFGKTRVCTERRRLARSSAWWFVYSLMQIKDRSLLEVPKLVTKDSYDSARAAFEKEKAQRAG